MRITVFGAGGRTGRLLVARAVAGGHEVTAVTRAAEPPAATGPGRLEIHPGDVRHPESVRAAVKGRDAVLSLVAPPLRKHVVRGTSLYSASAASLVRAMEPGDRLVTVSSAGVLHGDPSHPPLYRMVLKPLLMDRALYRDMRVMEKTVEDSDLDWTIVRASGLTNGPATGAYRVGNGRLPEGGSRLSRADLSEFLLARLLDRDHLREHPTLAY